LLISVVNLDEAQPEGTPFPEKRWSDVVIKDIRATKDIRVEAIPDRETAERLIARNRRAAVIVFGPTFSDKMHRSSFLAKGDPPPVNPLGRDGANFGRMKPSLGHRMSLVTPPGLRSLPTPASRSTRNRVRPRLGLEALEGRANPVAFDSAFGVGDSGEWAKDVAADPAVGVVEESRGELPMDIIWEELTSGLIDARQLVHVLIRLTAATLLGAAIGIQRERAGKPAGLRTHILVTLGTAVFVLACSGVGMSSDALSRVIQGLVTGIGFIGAGSILKLSEQRDVQGLTTAAGVWMTAAIGVAVGLGSLGVALLSTIFTLVILSLAKRFERGADSKRAREERHD
jgi:putative Mg2+ transporter-C (MgtC) family protein